MTIRVSQLILSVLLLAVGGVAGFALGRGGHSTTRTVVHVVSIAGGPSGSDGAAYVAAQAKSNVRAAIPAAEEYYQTTGGGSYAALTAAAMQAIAPGIAANVKAVAVNSGAGYCIEDSEDSGTTTYHYVGGDPGKALQSGYSASTISAGTCVQAVSARAR